MVTQKNYRLVQFRTLYTCNSNIFIYLVGTIWKAQKETWQKTTLLLFESTPSLPAGWCRSTHTHHSHTRKWPHCEDLFCGRSNNLEQICTQAWKFTHRTARSNPIPFFEFTYQPVCRGIVFKIAKSWNLAEITMKWRLSNNACVRWTES